MLSNRVSYSLKARYFVQAGVVSTCLLFQACSDGAPKLKDASEQTVYVNTKGIETIVNEVEPGNSFKIVDETLLDKKDESRAIIHNLDQTIDTLSMAAMSGDSDDPRNSSLRRTLMGGLAIAYFTNRAGAITPQSSSYANKAAYNKSAGLTSRLKSSALPKKVSIPGSSSKGYGAGKSFRSFGG